MLKLVIHGQCLIDSAEYESCVARLEKCKVTECMLNKYGVGVSG